MKLLVEGTHYWLLKFQEFASPISVKCGQSNKCLVCRFQHSLEIRKSFCRQTSNEIWYPGSQNLVWPSYPMAMIIIKQLSHCFTTKHFLKNACLLHLFPRVTLYINDSLIFIFFSNIWSYSGLPQFSHLSLGCHIFSLSLPTSSSLMVNCYN